MLQAVPVPDLAARFIAKPLQLLIGGEWTNAKSGKTFDMFDPATGLPIAKAAEGDAADIDAAVAAARAAFESGPWPVLTHRLPERGAHGDASAGRKQRGASVDTWTMVAAENGQDLVLTLHAPDGCTVSFAAKPWQVQGMATIATYEITDRPAAKRLH